PAAAEGAPPIIMELGKFSSTVGLTSPSVSIDWGDGSGIDTTTGAITTAGTTSTVTGSHTYTKVGAYVVNVTATAGGAAVMLAPIAVVADAALTVTAQNISG